jgi:hypothetical protein
MWYHPLRPIPNINSCYLPTGIGSCRTSILKRALQKKGEIIMKAKRLVTQRGVWMAPVSLLLLACPILANYTEYPTDDVCVRSDFPDTQGNPTGTLLYVGGRFLAPDYNDYWASYLKFDLSNYAGGTINSATLYWYCYDFTSPSPGNPIWVSAYEVTSDPYNWSEYTMTWNANGTIITVSGTVAAMTQLTNNTTWYSWDLTTEARSHQGGDFSVCMKTRNQPTSDEKARFYSKDFSNSTYHPYLSINYTPPEPPCTEHSLIDYLAGVDLSIYCLPGGTGLALSDAYALGGTTVDATVGVNLYTCTMQPVAGWPAVDLWLGSPATGLVMPEGMTIADGPTDINGHTTFSGPIYAGGSGMELVVQIAGVGTINGTAPYHLNSPDINADGSVNLSDVVEFAQDFYSGSGYRSDFFYDGTINLSDLVILAQGMGSAFP